MDRHATVLEAPTPDLKRYTGIGSRKTPPDVLEEMTAIARDMARSNFVLRSGGAAGADSAFEVGCNMENSLFKEIYLPWKRFNQNESPLFEIPAEAFEIASQVHPKWNYLKRSVKRLHARNVLQVLGANLQSPSAFVVCWTENGEEVGGTATAIRLAKSRGIRVINLATDTFEKDIYKSNQIS